MKLRSDLKIEALVLKAYPNAEPFRDAGYEELYQKYESSCQAWERVRDSICTASHRQERCICDTDPRLKDHPLRQHCIDMVNEVNRADRVAYEKLVVAQKNLRCMYHRINELKSKVHTHANRI